MGIRTIAVSVGCIAVFCLPAMPQSKDLSTADRAFLKMAADANMTEANLGQMAQEKASEPGVKDFGQKLVQDHTAAYQDLQKVADKIGEKIPTGIDIRKDAAAAQLMRLKGKAFDRQFVRDEIRGHERTIAEFKREAERGQNADIKAYAKDMLPKLEDHLHAAEQLAKPETAKTKKST